MLQTLNFIKERGFSQLTEQLAIKVKESPVDERVILNYCQINSPKENQIVRECRALTVTKQGELVARSFPRFFNAGEALSITRNFNWQSCKAWDKLDGSLIKIFYWKNAWRIQTRHSFADSKIQEQPYTWEALVRKCLNNTDFWKFEESFRHVTFVCELCSPYNQVVTFYPEPIIYLLSGFERSTELDDEVVDGIAKDLKIARPQQHLFYSLSDAQSYIEEQAKLDKTFEGVVLKDDSGLRLKVKSPQYLALSRMFCNGNLFLEKNLVPLVMDGEVDEVAVYFPEVMQKAEVVKKKIEEAWQEVDNLWFCYHDEKSKKKFALAVKDSPFCGVLFAAYDSGGHPKDYWTADFILKKVFNGSR